MKMDVKTIGILFIIVIALAGAAYMGMRPEETSQQQEVTDDSTTTTEEETEPPESPTEEETEEQPVTLEIPPRPDTPNIPEGTPCGWEATYTEIYSNDLETHPELGLDITGVEITHDEAIQGSTSIKMDQYTMLFTDPETLPIEPNTYYVFEFDYRLLSSSSGKVNMETFFIPAESTSTEEQICCQSMFSNEATEGTFSGGALTASQPNYKLKLFTAEGTSIIVDNIKLYRIDPLPRLDQPDKWQRLMNLPYPRLGNNQMGNTFTIAYSGQGMMPDKPENELAYVQSQVEERLSQYDIIAGLDIAVQSQYTGFVKRMRDKNPDIVLLPYRCYPWQSTERWPSPGATIDLKYVFMDDMPEAWYVHCTDDDRVQNINWPELYHTNIYPGCPVVDDQTYSDYLLKWTTDIIMGSGIWDGVYYDDLMGTIDNAVGNAHNPALLDFDMDNDGERDETPAQVSEETRASTISYLETLREEIDDLELVMGNEGSNPHLALSQYLNGHQFEDWDEGWYSEHIERSEAAWCQSISEYFYAQEHELSPQINILTLYGKPLGGTGNPPHNWMEPTSSQINQHRFGLGSALLGDGFYEFDLWDCRSAPTWFDEFSVNNEGVAIEDRNCKGYLGMPLGDPIELASTATTIWEETFEAGSIPSSITGEIPHVYVSQEAENIIAGTGSLIIDNPDHATSIDYIEASTKSSAVAFESGKTYVIEFDWEILETFDDTFTVSIIGSNGIVDSYWHNGEVKGDAGKTRFHVTLPTGSNHRIYFQLMSGGGKIAIDNLRVTEGGAGPWRRDFENGFVLVNPLNKPYTFTAEELSGSYARTDIKRILGTQAPEINNGEPVTETLTLEPFDAIILLSDPMTSP